MRLLIVASLLLLGSQQAWTQMDKVIWTFSSEKVTDQEYNLILEAEVEPGWYIYSQFLESDQGPIATAIYLDENDKVQTVGEAAEEGKKIDGFDPIFQMNISKYKDSVKLIQRIKIEAGVEQVSGYVTFMTCNNDQCLPPKDVEFSISL